jgi:uncharacterized protein (TIGR03437 family)
MVLFLGAFQSAVAQPVLRLVVPLTLQQSSGVPQPIWITPGTDGPADLFFEAVNDGDGALALTVDGGAAPWLLPAVTGTGPCTSSGLVCTVIAVRFGAAGLPQATYDGDVVVRDPAAIDAPQRVPIRIYVGTNVPDRVDLFVPPMEGSTDTADFQTAGGPAPVITTESAGSFLTVSSSGLGSVRAVHSHRVVGTYSAGLPMGENAGSFTITGSSFAADNRTVPVTLTVTDGPIAELGISTLEMFTSAGFAAEHSGVARTVVVANRGGGDLAVTSVDVATETGGDWLSVEDLGSNAYTVRAAVGELGAGLYSGTLSFNSNAANSPVVLIVLFEVRPADTFELNFQGAVNGANFSPVQPLGLGVIASAFGFHLSDVTANVTETPLPTSFEEVKVLINGVAAPIFFVSFGQVNFLVPFELAVGDTTVQVMRGDAMSGRISATVDVRSPGIFRLGIREYGIITNFSQGGNFPLPTDVGTAFNLPAAPARGGDVLIIWATGLGSVTPAVPSGEVAPFDPLSQADVWPVVKFGIPIFAPTIDPAFVGLSPGSVALFQVNVALPEGLGANDRLPVALFFPDGAQSNTVEIAVEP